MVDVKRRETASSLPKPITLDKFTPENIQLKVHVKTKTHDEVALVSLNLKGWDWVSHQPLDKLLKDEVLMNMAGRYGKVVQVLYQAGPGLSVGDMDVKVGRYTFKRIGKGLYENTLVLAR